MFKFKNEGEMKVLVTGGAGFIGSHLCETMLKNGSDVICLDNLDNYYSVDIKKKNMELLFDYDNFIFIKGDILNTQDLEDVFRKNDIEIVIHLAAKAGVRPSIIRPKDYFNVNVNGTINVLEKCQQYKIKKTIFASSSSVYGNIVKAPSLENDSSDRQLSPYAVSKKTGELLCSTYNSIHNLPIACCRFFTVYGPRQRPEMAIYKFIKNTLLNKEIEIYGDGEMKRDYTYIEDIVEGILGILKVDYDFDIVNLGSSNPISLNNLIAIIETSLNRKSKITYTDKKPGDVNITYADITKAREIYNYHPNYSLDLGLRKFVDWFEKQDCVISQVPDN